MKTSIKTHEGRLALVTGAAQVSGKRGRGAPVIATDLNPPHETVRRIGAAACALELDATHEEHWRLIAAKTRDLGEVDIVVNNGG